MSDCIDTCNGHILSILKIKPQFVIVTQRYEHKISKLGHKRDLHQQILKHFATDIYEGDQSEMENRLAALADEEEGEGVIRNSVV